MKYGIVKKNKEAQQLKDQNKDLKERNNQLGRAMCENDEKLFKACNKRDELSSNVGRLEKDIRNWEKKCNAKCKECKEVAMQLNKVVS